MNVEEQRDKKKENESLEPPAQEQPIVVTDLTVAIMNPDVTIREEVEEDGKYMLFNAENELVLVINSTGKYIMESCDGEKTVAHIIEQIEDSYAISEDVCLPEVVKNYLSLLLKAKLVKIVGEAN